MSSDNIRSRRNKYTADKDRFGYLDLPEGWEQDSDFSYKHQTAETRVSIQRVASDDPAHRDDVRWYVDISRPDMDGFVHPAPKQISLAAAQACAADYMWDHPDGELPAEEDRR